MKVLVWVQRAEPDEIVRDALAKGLAAEAGTFKSLKR